MCFFKEQTETVNHWSQQYAGLESVMSFVLARDVATAIVFYGPVIRK